MDSGDVGFGGRPPRAEPRANRGWLPITLIVIALLVVLAAGLLTLQWSLIVLPTFVLLGLGIGVAISRRRSKQPTFR